MLQNLQEFIQNFMFQLLTRDNVKLLDQLKSGLKRTTNWNKYQSIASIPAQKQYLE